MQSDIIATNRKSWDFARFWSKVKVGDPKECWAWQAGVFKDRDGYGQFSYQLKPHYAHRISWMFVHGEIPESICVLHRCDNPVCVNPTHLFLGTKADNVADMISKQRYNHPGQPGEQNGMSRVNAEQVREIRRLYDAGGISQYKLADMFNIHQATVGRIVRRETWKPVE